LAEVRFLYASALKQMGRNRDAMQQVLKLLDAQQTTSQQNPESWIYWRQRAGNDIANQLYKEGDYLNALEIYLNLVGLDKSPPGSCRSGISRARLRTPGAVAESHRDFCKHPGP
jgi:tetratricopeptide (TPR) repeat protein